MISIVIPLYDEQEGLALLYERIVAVAGHAGLSELEILFIDDGSRDGSWEVIAELAARDARVQGIRFRRNFGKAAALSAGFRAACGGTVLTLDADLQDEPTEIPRFLSALADGYDVVSGWKRVRHDPWHKVWPSRIFNLLVSRLTGVSLHDHNCGFKAYRREVLSEIHLYGELHRFIPVLAAARGFRIGEIEVRHRARPFGHSKYGMGRFLKGFLDLLTVKFLTGFGQRPQHLLGTVGLSACLLGSTGLAGLVLAWLAHFLWGTPVPASDPGKFILLGAVAVLLFGLQLTATGLLGELLAARTNGGEDSYSIAEQTRSRPGLDARRRSAEHRYQDNDTEVKSWLASSGT